MKKIFIALVLIFGITIAAQNNTTGQEKIYTQEDIVDLKLQMQEQKIFEMQKSVEDKIGMQDKYIDNAKEKISAMQRNVENMLEIQNRYVERVESNIGFWIGVLGALMTLFSAIMAYYIYKRTNENKKEINNELEGLIRIKKEAEKALVSINMTKEKTENFYSDAINNSPDKKQSKEQKEELSDYIEEIKRKKPESELTAKDWFLLGYDAQMKERYEDVCFYYKKATEIDQNFAEAYNNWGVALSNLTRLKSDPILFDESIIKYKKAIESKSNYADAYNNWGKALSYLAQLKSDEALYKESCEKYSKAIKVDPNDADTYNNWGNALSALAQLKSDLVFFEESFDKYKKAIELKPDYANAYNNWGASLLNFALLKSNPALFEESIIKNKKAIEIKFNFAEAYDNWGNALMQLAKFENNLDSRKQEIEALLLKANEIRRGASSYNLACLYTLTREEEKAFQDLEEDLECNKGIRGRDFIENDADFATLKENPRFRQLLDKYFPKEKP
ncbi:hypothetical protein EZS27_029581 [termite gut metagenome]|uniref:Uncharacterized protein n=1 Tax=termite gut metagenome TaxID=433724 RepID=A0A5J4QGI5_9ZZZZ